MSLAVEFHPYSEAFTFWSFVGTAIIMLGIWIYFRKKR